MISKDFDDLGLEFRLDRRDREPTLLIIVVVIVEVASPAVPRGFRLRAVGVFAATLRWRRSRARFRAAVSVDGWLGLVSDRDA